MDAAYAERKYLYRNLRNGQFEDVSLIGGSGITAAAPARGFAIGDYDNDGCLDAVVNCVNAPPQLLRCDSTLNRSWIKIRTVGTKSNRTGIGARIKVVAQTGTPLLNAKPGSPLTQIEEVRSSNGYFSASDLRIHFGLGDAKKADLVEIRWPSGAVDTWKDLDVESPLRSRRRRQDPQIRRLRLHPEKGLSGRQPGSVHPAPLALQRADP